ncbi:EamA family transporter [Rhodospirillaceae bacterium KN72]|uniref:EamA family transporter n=1 Tax=Pacificispira spongiicola TaxID=2729598 RepID=A0A7Y0DWR0_9PROT|nr:EamA family transporter [Pacificispira spongiicola]NMM43009.1 EamA family transporter [Pacificispira spongiicola]
MTEKISGYGKIADRVPPHAWFGVSAVFHYLGPSFAVLLFPSVGVLGVAWFRVASAAAVFCILTSPVRVFRESTWMGRGLLVGLGLCLAVMNTSFYLALDTLPMSLVAAMEFIGTIAVALYGLRTGRNLIALILTVSGVFVLVDVVWQSDPWGLFWSTVNAALFVGYIVLGHRAAAEGADRGVERLGAAMVIAFLALLPVGIAQAATVFTNSYLVLAGIGVGVCSSVIPYICDQLSMSRLPRGSFALMLALLPATATIIAAIVLSQIPTLRDLIGIALVMLGVAMHRPAT